MIKKTGPDLLRQTLTRFWFYNIYVQKPYKLGYNFLYIFKLIYLIDIFLTYIRPLRKNTYLYQLKYQIKKNTYRLIEIGTNKLVTIRLNQQHNKLNIFVNIFSRKTLFPKNTTTFANKNTHHIFKKKLKIFDYMQHIIKKILYIQKFYNIFKKNKIKNNLKIKNMILLINIQKKKNRIKNLHVKNNKFQSTIINFFNKNTKKYTNQIFNFKLLRRIIFRPLKKRKKIIFIENTKYFQRFKKNKHKFKKKKFNKYIKNLIFHDNPKINKIKKIFFIWKIKNNDKKIKNKIDKRNEILLYINLTKIKKQITKNLKYLQTEEITKQKRKIIERIWNYKIKKNLKIISKFLFVKNQLFNQFLEFKLNTFLFNFIKNKQYTIFFKNEFTIPKALIKVNQYEKTILQTTKFLKSKNKFYNNFINILPNIEMYMISQALSNQIAIELSRTKKHWKVIKNIELLLIQTYTQMKKNPINIFPNIKGIQIIIKGRPNKIARTKTIIFKIGVITKASYEKTNVTKSFAKSNAQIGSFGVHILIVK